MRNRLKFLVITTIGMVFLSINLQALEVGQELKDIQIRTVADKPTRIPGLGKKVVVIFYTDPDVSDQNDPFSDQLKAAKFPKDKLSGVGIANLNETWKPNWLIKQIIKMKIKKYKSTILTDPSSILEKGWNLGESDEKSIVIVVGKDKRVHYIKKGKMSKGDRQKAFDIAKNLVAKL